MTNAHSLGYRILPRLEQAKDSPWISRRLEHPVVLLRGLGRSSRFWLGFEHHLQLASQVVLVDLLGTGMSPARLGRWTVKGHANDVAATLDKLALEKVHLVAISFGAMVAIEAARILGYRCLSGVFMAPSARFTREQRINPRALVDLAGSLRHPRPRHRSFAHHLVSRKHLAENPTLIRTWDALYETEGFSRLAAIGQITAAARFGSRESLENLDIPAFFMVSRDDGLVSWRNAVVMSQTAPKGSLHVFEGPGHDLPTEIPEELAHRVLDFCGAVERGGTAGQANHQPLP
jgi:3-oxoadipate enol-lactonase